MSVVCPNIKVLNNPRTTKRTEPQLMLTSIASYITGDGNDTAITITHDTERDCFVFAVECAYDHALNYRIAYNAEYDARQQFATVVAENVRC
jgi:hypothetical protein